MKFAVIIPTTGGPLLIRHLRPRPALPSSSVFAEGDFRPLTWSGDYARLCAKEGPLQRIVPALVPHELRLSGSFDAGRSWEVPVALAHLLLARGHEIVGSIDDADAVLFATGAVDLDLAPIAGDYALLDKLERLKSSRLDLAKAGKRLFLLLPSGPEQAAAHDRSASDVPHAVILPSDNLPAIAARIDSVTAPKAVMPLGHATAAPVSRRGLWTAAALITLSVGAGGVYAWQRHMPIKPAVVLEEREHMPTPGSNIAPEQPNKGKTGERETLSPPPKPKPLLAMDELRAPTGGSCKAVLFGSARPTRKPVVISDDRQAPTSRWDDTLCGVALKPALGSLSLTLSGDLEAASMPVMQTADREQIYLLKASTSQNLLYQIQINGKDGDGKAVDALIRHSIDR
jgi:hypothetical protein